MVKECIDTYLKDYKYYTSANLWTELMEELRLEKRILEEQGEVITYNIKDLENLK